eukprot:2150158-Amphidinium_carterae.2
MPTTANAATSNQAPAENQTEPNLNEPTLTRSNKELLRTSGASDVQTLKGLVSCPFSRARFSPPQDTHFLYGQPRNVGV